MKQVWLEKTETDIKLYEEVVSKLRDESEILSNELAECVEKTKRLENVRYDNFWSFIQEYFCHDGKAKSSEEAKEITIHVGRKKLLEELNESIKERKIKDDHLQEEIRKISKGPHTICLNQSIKSLETKVNSLTDENKRLTRYVISLIQSIFKILFDYILYYSLLSRPQPNNVVDMPYHTLRPREGSAKPQFTPFESNLNPSGIMRRSILSKKPSGLASNNKPSKQVKFNDLSPEASGRETITHDVDCGNPDSSTEMCDLFYLDTDSQ